MKQHESVIKAILFISALGAGVYGFVVLDIAHSFLVKSPTSTFRFRIGILLFCAIISMLYVVRIGQRNLRELPGVKIFVVVMVYVFLTCIFPFRNYSNLVEYWKGVHWLFNVNLIIITSYVFGIALLFDIADKEVDPKSQKTIPQIIGVKASVALSVLLLLPQVLVFLGAHPKAHEFNLFILAAHMLFFIGFVQFAKNRMYINFWGEAMLGLVGLIYWII